MPSYSLKVVSSLLWLVMVFAVLNLNVGTVTRTRRAPPNLLSPILTKDVDSPPEEFLTLYCFLRFLVCVLVLLLCIATCDSAALIGSVERGRASSLKTLKLLMKPRTVPVLWISYPRYSAGGVVSNRLSAAFTQLYSMSQQCKRMLGNMQTNSN
jgi:energy-coupling factor transporter transmembrane protein EcfT